MASGRIGFNSDVPTNFAIGALRVPSATLRQSTLGHKVSIAWKAERTDLSLDDIAFHSSDWIELLAATGRLSIKTGDHCFSWADEYRHLDAAEHL